MKSMPQLSLYIDEEMLCKIEAGASLKKTSVSKFVSAALKEYFSQGWPEGYQNLFGSATDDSFVKPDSLDLGSDAPRESL
jgi:hypothetical protein